MSCKLEDQARIPVGPDNFYRGCAYTVLQTVQRHEVCSAVYGTVHYKELLKSFEIRVGHSPGFGLPSVAILTLCALSRIYTYKRNVWVATFCLEEIIIFFRFMRL